MESEYSLPDNRLKNDYRFAYDKRNSANDKINLEDKPVFLSEQQDNYDDFSLGNKDINENEENISITLLGKGKYEVDAKRRAEDTSDIDKNVLSKEAKTLSVNKQIGYLESIGINTDEYIACKSNDDGTFCFKSHDGTNFYRVVNHNGENKVIHTVIIDNKASFDVYQINNKEDEPKKPQEEPETVVDEEAAVVDGAQMIKEDEDKAEKPDKSDKTSEKTDDAKTDKIGKSEKTEESKKPQEHQEQKTTEKLQEPKQNENKPKINIEKCVDDLFNSLDGVGTDNDTLTDILFDEYFSDEDIVKIVKRYEEKYGLDNGSEGLISNIDGDTSGDFANKLSSQLATRLVNTVNNGNEEGEEILCKELYSATVDKKGTVDGFIKSVFDNMNEEAIAKLNKKYAEVYQGRNLVNDIKDEYYDGFIIFRKIIPFKTDFLVDGDAIVSKINKALRHNLVE